jgi:hypothetical protein
MPVKHKPAARLGPAQGWRPKEAFGDRLRMVRRAYGDTNGRKVGHLDMADLVGWGEKAYVSYEAGYHVPADVWAFALAVAAATGCDPVWLAGDELPPPDGGQPHVAPWFPRSTAQPAAALALDDHPDDGTQPVLAPAALHPAAAGRPVEQVRPPLACTAADNPQRAAVLRPAGPGTTADQGVVPPTCTARRNHLAMVPHCGGHGSTLFGAQLATAA